MDKGFLYAWVKMCAAPEDLFAWFKGGIIDAHMWHN